MSEETLVPNGDDSGWPTGTFADLDEGIASADGLVMSTDADGEGDVLNLDFTDSGVVDGDTVTNIDIVVRAKIASGPTTSDTLHVDLLFGGVPVGTQQATGTLTDSFQNFTLNDGGVWNGDRTAAEMDGLQVRLTPAQAGMPVTLQWDVDVVDVVITFTPASVGSPVIMAMLQSDQYGGAS